MNIYDLMLGDWVSYDGENCRVIDLVGCGSMYPMQLGVGGLFERCIRTFLLQKHETEDVGPIYITGEILEKSGWKHFGKDNKKTDFHGIEHWTAYKCEAWRMNDNKVLYFRIQSEDYQIQYCGKIQYVHELQHALKLVGVEMEITL